jgi:hypothetical protein
VTYQKNIPYFKNAFLLLMPIAQAKFHATTAKQRRRQEKVTGKNESAAIVADP